jgi:outer membrane protein OmpA-like peptidoglycan-associated protein
MSKRANIWLAAAGACLLSMMLAACAPSSMGPMPSSASYSAPWAAPPHTGLATQNQTVDLENADRVARFQRLARSIGVSPPIIESDVAPAGTAPGLNGPVPVVRVTFPDGVLFDSDSDQPRPEAAAILRLIAENMRRDVPDAAMTILGHTDSTASEQYNNDLSRRRALSVMRRLSSLGVDPYQMTTVAIGFHQPIASNETPEGRARNRRVEFLISANVEANLAVVQRHLTSPMSTPRTPRPSPSERAVTPISVQVLQAAPVGKRSEVTLSAVGPLQIQPISTIDPTTVNPIALAPPPIVSARPAATVAPAPLTDQKVS